MPLEIRQLNIKSNVVAAREEPRDEKPRAISTCCTPEQEQMRAQIMDECGLMVEDLLRRARER